MSSTKLTLTISNADVIQDAKAYAKEQGRSLSAMVENYLKSLKPNNNPKTPIDDELTPLVKSLLGSVPVPEGWNYKEALMDALEEKYMK